MSNIKYPERLTISSSFFMLSFLMMTVFHTAALVFIGLLGLVILLALANKSKVTLMKEDTRVFYLFYIVPFVSLSLMLINIIIHGIPYIEFCPGILGRMINSVVYLLVFIYIINQRNKDKISAKTVMNSYLIGCFILLVFGLWQLSSLLFHIPYPDFVTRTHIHSMDTSLLPEFMTMRITSIAREPAYLIPYLMDAAIILFFTRKRKIIVIPFVIVLLFTLSLSGYVNLLFIALAVFFLTKLNRGKILFVCLAVPVIFYVLIRNMNVFIAVFSRLKPDDLLKHGRLQEILVPVEYMFSQTSPFNLLFGYGIKGLVYISQFIFYKYGYRAGDNIAPESHVIFADYFLDYGLAGLILNIALFVYLWTLAARVYKLTNNRLAQVLCINLFVTSLYTSDFAAPRFTVIILLILFLYKDSRLAAEMAVVKQ